jgi:CHAD domain-containing protein
MAFIVEPDQAVAKQLLRAVRSQLKGAIAALDEGDQAVAERVHDVRTSLKKVRAVLQMVESAANGAGRRSRRRLRAIGREVSAVRDAGVLLETADSLFRELGLAASEQQATHARLEQQLQEAARRFERSHRARRLKAQLRAERGAARQWTPTRHVWGRLGSGLEASYRRARSAMQEAYRQNSAECFHEWRKRVKAHRYQRQLLEAMWPASERGQIAELERLGDVLGQDHDLFMLRQALAERVLPLENEADYATVVAAIDERHARLRHEAAPLGARLFAAEPEEFRRLTQARLRELRAKRAKNCEPS